jgi:predicted AlkP superfamily phosphohydrolase/phosphomutase
MFFNAIKKTRKGMVVCVFETTDSIQHMFYRYLDKAHPALKTGQARMSAAVVEDLYRRMDDLVGRVEQTLDDRGVLIIMSDHGFKSFRRGVNLNSWLWKNGYLFLKEGTGGDGEWFKDVDWTRTKAYALGLGGLYLNLKGREAQGIVEPGAEATALKAELMTKLGGLKDGANGPAGINILFDRDAVYRGPYRENAPDLIVGYAEGYRASWDSVTGKVTPSVFEDNLKAWSGDHCIDPRVVPGVFFMNGSTNGRPPSIMDIAPTVMELFGVAVPAHMDGRSLLAAEGAAARTAVPPSQKRSRKGRS